VAVQFSLSYDANGDPVLVENTVTGTRKVVSTSPVVSEYKSRFETPASEDTNTDTDTQVQYSAKLLNEYADKYKDYVCNYLNENKEQFNLYKSDTCSECNEDSNNTNMYFYGF